MIVFIRHAETKIDPDVPSYQWTLTETAYQACKDLARELQTLNLKCIVTSKEFKAKETGRVIAEVLHLPYEELEHLHEHQRKYVPFMDAKTFQQILQAFFANPDKLIWGQETANQALQRFDQAVKDVLRQYPQPFAIVTHASVLSLFIAHYNTLNAYTFWQDLKMPDKVVTDTNFKLV